MWNVLNRMRNEIIFFCDFCFSSYRENSSKIRVMTSLSLIAREIKIWFFFLFSRLFFSKFQNFSFKSFQIYMKDLKSAESKEKPSFQSIWFLFFEFWSFFFSGHPNLWWIFTHNSRRKKIVKKNLFRFSEHRFPNRFQKSASFWTKNPI